MSLFRHPHITRGVVWTPKGAFSVSRGIVDAPDDVGRSMGWEPVEEEDAAGAEARKFLTTIAASGSEFSSRPR